MNISNKSYREIKVIAIECYKRYRTRNPFIIFEKLGIGYNVIELKGNLAGFTSECHTSAINEEYPFFVYINSRYDSYSQKIIAAHELGHILLHKGDDLNMLEESDSSYIKEYEANIFAMEFMPQIQPHDKKYISLSPSELQEYICSKLI